MKHLDLSLENPEKLQQVAHALSSELRLNILRLLDECSMNVQELSQRLHMPISTVSNSLVVLEEAELIRTERQNGVRGLAKLCSRRNDTLSIRLHGVAHKEITSRFYSMPIGAFMDCSITPTCGMLSSAGAIGEQDAVAPFYDPLRFEAQLLWFKQGYVEYRFADPIQNSPALQALEVSFEACSEAPNYRVDWPSDITVSINDVELGTWCCPGDFGGRQGQYTPLWWRSFNTQYGMLKRWRVTRTGTFLNDERISDITLDDLYRAHQPYISIRIAVKQDAEHVGGINLFGDKFGDYRQSIVLRLDTLEND